MKRPSFQFYTGDWTANPNLRRCTFAEKGIWIDVLCLMHDQPEYGVLRWPLKEIAEAVKCRPADLQALLRKGVLKGHDKQLDEPFIYVPRSGRKDGDPVVLLDTQPGPIWYSSRMVKDEHVRTIRGEGTRFGDAPKHPPNHAPKPPFGDGASSSSSSSSSSLPSVEEEKERAQPLAEPKPTAAGLACRAMKSAGLPQVNPGDPRLIALCDQGATVEEFEGIAAEAVEKGKGWGWVLDVLPKRRAEAAGIKLAPRPSAYDPFVGTV